MIPVAGAYIHQPYYQALAPQDRLSPNDDWISTIYAPPTRMQFTPSCCQPGNVSTWRSFERCPSYGSDASSTVAASYGYVDSCPETPTSHSEMMVNGKEFSPKASSGTAYRTAATQRASAYSAVQKAPAHTSLTGRFEYVAFPAVLPQHPEAKKKPSKKDAPFEAFFGQVKFEATAATIRWVISQVTRGSVSPLHIHRRGPGCFLVYFATAEDRDRLIALNETVLFDNDGIWIAHSTSQVEELRTYAGSTSGQVVSRSRRLRLPKSCVVIRK